MVPCVTNIYGCSRHIPFGIFRRERQAGSLAHPRRAWFLTEGGGGVARPGAGQAEPAPNAASGAAEAPKSRVDEVHREATPKAPLTLEGRPRTPAPPHHPNTHSPMPHARPRHPKANCGFTIGAGKDSLDKDQGCRTAEAKRNAPHRHGTAHDRRLDRVSAGELDRVT